MRFSDNLPPMTDDEYRECMGIEGPDLEAEFARQDFDRKYKQENTEVMDEGSGHLRDGRG